MSANTILLDFSVDPATLEDKGSEEIVTHVVSELEAALNGEPLTTLLNGSEITGGSKSDGGTVSLFLGPRGSSLTIRVYYESGLVTINLDYYLRENETPLLTLERVKELESRFQFLKTALRVKSFPALRRGAKIDVYMTTSGGWLSCHRKLEAAWSARAQKVKPVKTLPVIRRGIPFDIYFYSSDERLLEYDIDTVLLDERSPYQHIQIMHSLNFGNLLVLDDLQNLAESDLVYTESIMRRGVEDYAGKTILILGGGDGALLHELRKENPEMVTMIEIDDLVMQACKLHLRSVCGDTLDNYKGENYEIVVGDCVDYMTNCIERKFDYVFADLTDIPISQTPQGEMWDFIRKILNLSFRTLKSTGKYMTHGNGSGSPAALKMFEDVLETLEEPVTFTRTHAFIPSFMEDWVFYQVQRKPEGLPG